MSSAGHKTFVPFATEAAAMIVYAQLDNQPQAFLVRKGTAGLICFRGTNEAYGDECPSALRSQA